VNINDIKMPDLSDLPANLQGRSMLAIFVGEGGLSRNEVLYRRNFARLVDKAIREYEAAQVAVAAEIDERNRPWEQMVEEGRPFYILGFTDHFENCLNAINRALKLLSRMHKETMLAGLPRVIGRSLQAWSRSVPDVRDTFEHVDERIQKGEIAEGQPVMLWIGESGDRAVIGSDEVLFIDVARTLRRLHEIGVLLFENKGLNASIALGRAVGGESGPPERGEAING
jgi:hypothetical protein